MGTMQPRRYLIGHALSDPALTSSTLSVHPPLLSMGASICALNRRYTTSAISTFGPPASRWDLIDERIGSMYKERNS